MSYSSAEPATTAQDDFPIIEDLDGRRQLVRIYPR
jgi:hypothetical protein